jgi:hypothetical protein
MTSTWDHDTARLTQPFSDCRVVLIVVSAIDHVRPIGPGTLITGNSGLRLDPRKDFSQLVGSTGRQQQMKTRRGVERKRGVFGMASWRIVLGGTRFPWKYSLHEQKHDEVRENRRPLASPYQGERPKALSRCSRPLYLRYGLHSSKTASRARIAGARGIFRFGSIFDSARESPVSSSAVGRENSTSGAVRDWSQSCR